MGSLLHQFPKFYNNVEIENRYLSQLSADNKMKNNKIKISFVKGDEGQTILIFMENCL